MYYRKHMAENINEQVYNIYLKCSNKDSNEKFTINKIVKELELLVNEK